MAYIFLGDYTSARKLNNKINDEGIKTYISTFINKDQAEKNIDQLYQNDYANRYLYFSIISYFENNNVDLDTKEEVTITYGKETKKLNLNPLGKEYLTIYQKDLNKLKIDSKYKDIYINYYYEGTSDEIDQDKKVENIKIGMNKQNLKLGDIVNLNIDISNIPNNKTIKLYLPNGLRVSSGFKSDFASIISNKSDQVTIHIGEKKSSTISIPIYLIAPGEYKIEPIMIKENDKYQISNSLIVKVEE